jgi:anti-sigma B factor antagonist
MYSVDLRTRDGRGHAIVELHGELDVADAAAVVAVFEVIVALQPEIIVDLAGLEFIDISGVAALARGRKLARQAGGDLFLASPRRGVLRVLTVTRLIDILPVHASVDEAAGHARRTAAARAGRPALAVAT